MLASTLTTRFSAWSLFVCVSTGGCAPRPEGVPAEGQKPPAPLVTPSPALAVVHQQDDRDVTRAVSLRTSRGSVVLVTFRQPNRAGEAALVLRLDEGGRPTETRFLPARPGPPAPPELVLLDDPHGGLAIADIVPEPDPIGESMVGVVHFLRAEGVETKPLPRVPAGLRWAGPRLLRLDRGEIRIAVRGPRGEAAFRPFALGTANVDAVNIPASPATLPSGPDVAVDTVCDAAGCHTAIRLSPLARQPG